MGYIKAINNKEYIKATVMKTKENVVKVKAEKALPDMKNGFLFFLNVGDRKPAGKYEEYTTIFREYDATEKEYSDPKSYRNLMNRLLEEADAYTIIQG